MKRASPNIRPEASALGMRKGASSQLATLIKAVLKVRTERGLGPARLVAEYGCGQLRNLKELRRHFPAICLVDTDLQLSRTHDFRGKRMTIPDYIKRYYRSRRVTVLTERQFEKSRLKPDVIFSINVMDVVPRHTRLSILGTTLNHLPSGGQLAALVPRNDTRTLDLCTNARAYRDGYLFRNHGVFTHDRNWLGSDFQRLCRSRGFHLLRDLSRYRYCCIICQPRTMSNRRLTQTSGRRDRRFAK
jgi:Methyltransferase domain